MARPGRRTSRFSSGRQCRLRLASASDRLAKKVGIVETMSAFSKESAVFTGALPDGELPVLGEDCRLVEKHFQKAVSYSFGQAWQPEKDPGFLEGTVWVGEDRHALLVFARLEDRDIFNHGQAVNDF